MLGASKPRKRAFREKLFKDLHSACFFHVAKLSPCSDTAGRAEQSYARVLDKGKVSM